jgi:hypothetical protein
MGSVGFQPFQLEGLRGRLRKMIPQVPLRMCAARVNYRGLTLTAIHGFFGENADGHEDHR